MGASAAWCRGPFPAFAGLLVCLPDWFGRNWGAFADCLGDPGRGPASPGRPLVVGGRREYAAARPGEWDTDRRSWRPPPDRVRAGARSRRPGPWRIRPDTP
ncbi:barstar family protein [Streptomyces sp. NPDC054842]